MNTLTELLYNSVAQRIGWSLIHFLWQGAAVALLLAITLPLLRNRSARERWATSCAAMALMAVLPIATAMVVPVETSERSEAPRTAVSADPIPTPLSGGSGEFPTESESSSPLQPGLANSQELSEAVAPPVGCVPAAQGEQTASLSWFGQLQDAIHPVLPWAILVWLVGVITMSAWHFGGWIQVRGMRRLSTRPARTAVQEMFDRLLARLPIRRSVRLLESMRVAVPIAVGWLRPMVLLPVGAVTGLTRGQLEAILVHELAHVRRLDCLVQVLQAIMETLLFYHPGVWWVSRQIREESEQCCDDLAVGLCPDRTGYAHALAKVAELGAARQTAFAAAATGGKLLPRIRRILGAERSGPLSSARCLSGAFALVTIIAIILAVGVSCSSRPQSQAYLADNPATQPEEASSPEDTAKRFMAAGVGFAPVVERVVRAPADGTDAFLDLATGGLLSYKDSGGPNEPTMSKALSVITRRARWAKGSGADICLPTAGRFDEGVTGLVGLDMRMLATQTPFDRLMPRDVAEALRDRAFFKYCQMRCLVDKLPATFVIETRDGRLGVVQVAATTDDPVGVRLRYRLTAEPLPTPRTPLWITLAPSEPIVRSLKELTVLAAVRGLNQEAGRTGEWELRTPDNAKRVSRLPYPWSVDPDQRLPDGQRIIGGTNRIGRFGLDENRLRRVGPLASGDYLLAWYVGGKRCSNVMGFRIDPDDDSGDLPLLELTGIEPGPGRRLPVLVLRARRHAVGDPAPWSSDVAFPTVNIDGRDRTLSRMAWTGPDAPLRVGRHYTYLLDLARWDWDPKLNQAARPIDPDKPHVVFAKVGRGNVRQTPTIRLQRARPLAETWMRATPKLPAMPSDSGMGEGGPGPGLITGEEAKRRRDVLEKLDQRVAAQPTEAGKLKGLREATVAEAEPDVRRHILTRAGRLSSEVAEGWLIDRLKNEPDCHLRGSVATLLGKKGSQKAVEPLIAAGYSDKKTSGQIGCMRTQGTARRQALFALAEIGKRLPKARIRIVTALRRLPAQDDKADVESIYDVRRQALYQLTSQAELIQPFLKRLKSKDVNERKRGVVAFRFLKLRKAPPELIVRLKDPSPKVRSWAALVLGEIGDPGAAEALMAAAEDKSFQNSTRANAIVSLKRMKVQAACALMERLTKDPNGVVAYHAAAALKEIKGGKDGK